ncbi:hydrolase, TatD family [Beutenbergia cavernae DSM 12333]|uniref:Hydrolase, TatD family n=1 Tax=Beutenbergia cavernae (strain ATCC BAA-8 / DSM 12333 / CCUG 43141 / JCM 11478 / NBRC 16432 / NCIMB 13614 / HKI 0122) TaxID=471853 RepID=C5C047_BEUC1|nr:TatD family hydrolase [Beutenbergia cavernae]ACQ79233.1 hydrolase, TatD family [Beutenbergia cavernae DSM 12333]
MSTRPRERGWPPAPGPLRVAVVDNHTHLDAIAGVLPAGEAAPSVADELARAAAVGVDALVQIGCDLDAAPWSVDVARAHRAVVAGVAIHPNEAVLHAGVREVAPDGLEPDPQPRHEVGLDEAIARIADLARDARVRVVGETGLDFFRAGDAGRAAQRESFRAHIALAKELGLPLQIHDRDAHQDVLDVLDADGAPDVTVFHCFSGDAAFARVCAERGWYLSFAGPVTFRANDALRDAVASVPLRQILVETDAPFLTPHPYRGRPNAPYLLPHTVRMIAQVRREEADDVAAAVAATSARLYGPW